MRFLPILALAFAGCGGPAMTELSGTVSFDGQPVKQGGITFVPLDGNNATAGGMIKDGKYATKLAPGRYKVQINGNKTTQRALYDNANSPVAEISSELLPAKYHQATELTFDAEPGKQEKNWDLAK